MKLFLILKKFFFVAIFLSTLFFYKEVQAIDGYADFNVDDSFDASARSKISTSLVKTTSNIYFYIEKSWWDSQTLAKKNEILVGLDTLSFEFDSRIYPVLTSVFGFEWRPGVDGDNKITVLFHSMREGISGYFRSTDEYIKLQAPDSNEKEMIYLSLSKIDDSRLKVYLAHEFIHLITFNQKDRIQGVQEEVWLNEARAEYSSTILGYNDSFEGSNLQRRIKDFLEKPSDSLTEWQDTKYDYASVSLFGHYLIDHYGINIFSDSLKSKSVGINSINEILSKTGIQEDFSKIFSNWTIAVIINDCSISLNYCYLNKNIKSLKISPTINFLPLLGNSSLSVTNITKNWSGNWQKIIGGSGDLKLDFSSLTGLNFQVPYIIFDKNNNYSIEFLKLSNDQKGTIEIKDFGLKYNSLTILPSLQTKISRFNGLELTYPYNFIVSVKEELQEDQAIIQKLLGQIELLKKQIAAILSEQSGNKPCDQITGNLYFGVSNNEVRCLQHFLKSQSKDIYPEGLVTGNFGVLTKAAVIRFQEKYRNEVLTPIGLLRGTGFVGSLTRAKINQLLN